MSLRRKTLLIVGVTLVGLVGVLYATCSTILSGSMKQAEEENTRQTVKGVLSVFAQTQDDFNSRFADWSAWDETYNFMEGTNPEYIEANLDPVTVANLKINLALFINTSGKIVYGTGFDIKNQKTIPIPEALRRHLTVSDRLLTHPTPDSSLVGIIMLPEGPMLIISRPIVTTQGTGPIVGSLIFGRYLDVSQVEKLVRIVRLPLTVHRVKDTKLPPEFQAVREELLKVSPLKAGSEPASAVNRANLPAQPTPAAEKNRQAIPVHVKPLNEETIAGYTLIRDIYDQPALVLRVDIPREIYKQGQKNLNYLLMALTVVGLGFGGCTILLLERLVLSRLGHLTQDVSRIGECSDLSLRLSVIGKDELSILGLTINKMLAALQQAQNQQQESEERHRAVVEQSSEGICLIDVNTYRILEANQAFVNLLGYSPAEILKLKLYDIAVSDNKNVDHHVDQILAATDQTIGEQLYRRQDGSLVEVEVSANSISYGGRKVLCAVVRDITERKQAEKALQQSQERLRKQDQVLVELAKSRSLIQGDLQSVCRQVTETAAITLEVDRVSVWLYNEDRSMLHCFDAYELNANQHTLDDELAAVDYPIYFKALEQERTLVVRDVRTDARTLEFNSSYMNPLNVVALIDAPIRVGGQIVGVVCHEQTDTPRDWTLDEQNFAGSIADLVSLSLEARDRHRVEAALGQAEEKYRMIFENAIEGIFQTTPQGKYLSANPALARIYGYASPEELINNVTNISEQLYVHPSRREQFIEAMHSNGAVSNFESQTYRRDGSIIWVSENARVVRDGLGELLYYEGTVEDITKRKVVEEALRYQQEQSERLLLNILPESIAERLKQEEGTIADSFAEVTVLFADIVGFTELSSHISPTELVNLLNEIFSAFDRLAHTYELEKIKTIGDAYMVVGGLPVPRADHAEAIAEMAIAMQKAIALFNDATHQPLSIRIGINTGPVVAGVIGLKKFIYDLWGDTVNVASRMESQGIADTIQVTSTTYELLRHKYSFEERGAVEVKGKGKMTTYLLTGRVKEG
ncbi:MAG: PAS domain S-box protein [Microcoleus vaginatus WJT46-NPBG5]|jgi:PAS domain S-box-containing protein|nr:PAS domain S-box protein [Microcoleus vaginatus WJT46-NPBG5]